MSDDRWTGGCQCGAVRFSAGALGRASLCHCRMCQKASGSIGGLFVTANDLTWTRGVLKHFDSSNKVRRGFCADCGTPMTYEIGGITELSIAAFDRAGEIAPVIQLDTDARLPWFDHLAALPTLSAAEQAKRMPFYASVVSNQHPDHDTAKWPMHETP
jgi:hypothetical protein